ncbi:MAG TPA: alkaline phosphatase family protein, partial [Candidatus Limnocylindrales bacterium]|nr:alkaline phosphatase family protein [Candidatus Limnocylindrales bacterium]
MREPKLLARAISALAIISICAGPAMAKPPLLTTTTPIQHVVVIFQENVSFDHYFGTYPMAANTGAAGEPLFQAAPGTPSVNGLLAAGLLDHNPNFVSPNGNPFRLTRAQAATCDQDHGYSDEEAMFDLGLMDNFLEFNTSACGGLAPLQPVPNAGHPNDLIMGYYDGNTVTALWNYAQNFAMNDNSFGTGFGPSTPGVINLVSGNTNGAINLSVAPHSAAGDVVADGAGGFSVINDGQPTGDTCTTRDNFQMSGQNVGDLLNAAGVTWGNFAGGFDLGIHNSNGTTGCARTSTSATGVFVPKVDYIPHHEGFQYYASTANPTHARPSSVALIGQTDGSVNHQYDLHDFFDAVSAGNFPAVSFLKADGFQDGHAGYSSPLDEQTFIVNTINFIESQKDWKSTLIIIAYDDSDGWYDHQMSPIVSQSNTTADVGPAGPVGHPNVNAGKQL